MKARTESAILRNLLAETVKAYDERSAGGASPGATATRGSLTAEIRMESAVMRRILEATSLAYEEQVDALEAEKTRSRGVLAAVDDAVLTADASARLTHVNPAAEKLTGWGAAEARGRPLTDVLVLVGAEGAVAVDLGPCLTEGRTLTLRRGLDLMSRDGNTHPVEGRATAIRNSRRQIVGMVLILREQHGPPKES